MKSKRNLLKIINCNNIILVAFEKKYTTNDTFIILLVIGLGFLCMYLYMYVCMYVFIYLCINGRICVCVCVYYLIHYCIQQNCDLSFFFIVKSKNIHIKTMKLLSFI